MRNQLGRAAATNKVRWRLELPLTPPVPPSSIILYQTHLMVIAVCGGSPGGKDELDPGNGSTTPCAAAAAENKAAASELAQDADSSAARGAEPRSAQANAFAAAEAALQVRAFWW